MKISRNIRTVISVTLTLNETECKAKKDYVMVKSFISYLDEFPIFL